MEMFAVGLARSRRERQYVLRSKRKAEYSAMDFFAVVLAGLIGLEVFFALDSSNFTELRRDASVAQTIGLRTPDPADQSKSALSIWREAVLGRPLFDSTRRPPLLPSQPSALPEEMPRLSGIMTTPTEKIAVFAPAMGDPIIVSENSRFGPFTVLTIAADGVTVKGPNGVSVLQLDVSYQGKAGKTTPFSTILRGGIDLHLINVPLPSAATWPGPPPLQ